MRLLPKLFILFFVLQVKSWDDEEELPDENSTLKNMYLYIAVSVIVLLLIMASFLIYHLRRRNQKNSPNKFGKGNPSKINEKMTLEEQIDLLPYNTRYEFSRKKLKFGKQLGKGTFGIVRYATAQGIVPNEKNTTVAVKTINRTHDKELFQVSSRELKIMVHLGKHLNLVNLLGAVTKKLSRHELMVIVEYCPFGDLQTFLIKHRRHFIDQIVRGEDIIDPTITTKYMIQQRNRLDSDFNRFDEDQDSVVSNNSEGSDPNGMGTIDSKATLWTQNSNSSTNSLEQLPPRTVTTTDLLCWSFQIARGMQYLASQKVLHGYLAAKNVFLCNDNVVKIYNFGSMRSIYTIDNYLENRQGPMPFKWLSPETIDKKIFSTPSDVWSFGIVLWELFSLGTSPFMGIDDRYNLHRTLVNGYRLEKPHYSTATIYNIMLSCWRMNAELRPTFNDLEDRIYRLLERNVANHYIDLNEPYTQSNINRLNSGQADYLKLLFIKMTSSGYVEMNNKPNSGYVDMHGRRNNTNTNGNIYSQDSIV